MDIEFAVVEDANYSNSMNLKETEVGKDIYYGVVAEFLLHIGSHKNLPSYLQEYSIGNSLWFKFFDKSHNKDFYLFLDQNWIINDLKLPIEEIKIVAPNLCKEWSGKNSTVSNRFNLLWEQLNSSQFNILFFKAFVYNLIYRVIDEIEHSITYCRESAYYRKEKKKIEEVVEKSIQNIHEPIPKLEKMSQEVGMSVSKFKKLFKKIYGQSPYKYMLGHKLVYARKMHQTGEYTLSQIALKIGYSHISGFTKIYKKRFNER